MKPYCCVFERPACLAFVLFGALLVVGCNGRQGTKSSGGGDQNPPAVDPHCDELVQSLLSMLQPDHLGISSDATAAADLLNDWLDGCAADAGGNTDIGPVLKKYLGPEQLQIVGGSRFSERDALHFRDCFLFKRVLDFALRDASDDLQRVVRLFHYVIRNVALRDDPDRVPLTPYEIMMFGRGTPEERAWVFAELLRQLRIDAVIIRPSGPARAAENDPGTDAAANDAADPDETAAESGQQDRRWLIGVLLSDGVYLFDPQLGWPIPSLADDGQSIMVRQPATFAAVRGDDAMFRRLDVDEQQTYPLHAGDFEAVRVEVIGEASEWARRSALLQKSFTGDESAIIYDGLADGEFGRGLIGRVVDAGANLWKPEDVSVWPYPDHRLGALHALNANQQSKLDVMWHPFKAPWGFEINREEQRILMEKSPERRQLKTRSSQVLGHFAEAIRSYVTIQLVDPPEGFPLPPEIFLMHRRAAEDARFWMGVSQFEQDEFSAASHTFDDYLRRYGSGGIWFTQAFGLRAQSFAENDTFAAAVFALNQALGQLPPESPERHSFQLLAERWRAIRDAQRENEGASDTDDPAAAETGTPPEQTPEPVP